MLLGLAQSLAFELGVFDNDLDPREMNNSQLADFIRKRRLRRLVLTFVSQNSGRIGRETSSVAFFGVLNTVMLYNTTIGLIITSAIPIMHLGKLVIVVSPLSSLAFAKSQGIFWSGTRCDGQYIGSVGFHTGKCKL